VNVRSARLIHNLPRNSALLGVTFFLSEKETSDDSYISVKQGKAYALGVPPPLPPPPPPLPTPAAGHTDSMAITPRTLELPYQPTCP